jgi:hypothetical protein
MTKPSFSLLMGLPMALGLTIPAALAQQWTQLTSEVPYARYAHSAVYNPGTNQMIIFAGAESSASPVMNDVWLMNNANGATGAPSWLQETPSGTAPSARLGQIAVYDNANDRMIVFGGCLGRCLPVGNDTWVLVNATGAGGAPTWQQLSPAGSLPAARTWPAAVYDQANNRMIIFAGQDGSGSGGATYGDVWVLANANGLGGTPAWTQLSPTSGPPSGQYAPSAVYDQAHNVMTVFAGAAHGTSQATNAVWTLSNANGIGGAPVWTRIVANGAPGSPARREFQTATYDPASNRMTIYGGANGVVIFGDVWVLQNANGFGGAATWAKLTATASPQPPSAKSSHTAVYDTGTNRMVVFGGGTVEGLSYSTWVLTNANGL